MAWASGDDIVKASVLIDGVVGTKDLLVATDHVNLPSLIVGDESESPTGILSLRGNTQGFGAGTVTLIALVYLVFSQPGGLSNRGLPLPSW